MIKIPEDFNMCVKKGGKVRTMKPKEGKMIHICMLGGKTYKGEVKDTKKKESKENEVLEIKENQEIEFTEALSFSETEATNGLEVTYTVAEAGISNNNRRYFSKDLESQSLKGLKMFMDHTYEADNAIGKITDSWMEGRRLKAKAIIKNSAKHPDVVEMIRDGRIDSVSIGGKGDIRVVKEKDNTIEEVSNLQIREVSFVGIPGVARAKITKIGG